MTSIGGGSGGDSEDAGGDFHPSRICGAAGMKISLAGGSCTGMPADLSLPRESGLTRAVLSIIDSPDLASLADALIPPLSVGFITPRLVHGLNNSLVSIVGNLELADSCDFTGAEAAKMCEGARDAALMMADRVRSLASMAAWTSNGISGRESPLMDLSGVAGGRSIDVRIDWPAWSFRFSNACLGLSTACFMAVERSGSVEVRPDGDGLRIDWARASARDGGEDMRNYAVALLVALAAQSAFRAGGFVRIDSWGETSGGIRLSRRGDGSD